MATYKRVPRRGPRRRFDTRKAHGAIDREGLRDDQIGVVSFDVGKARSMWAMIDFRDEVLITPQGLEHTRTGFDGCIRLIEEGIRSAELKRVIVAVERTGNYDRPVVNALCNAGFEVRRVDPVVSNKLRSIQFPSAKCDELDLIGVHRAAVLGFGLKPREVPDIYVQLQLISRHRRDLVESNAKTRTRIQEHLSTALPGVGGLFPSDWRTTPAALLVALHFTSPAEILALDQSGIRDFCRTHRVIVRSQTIDKILKWASNAPLPDPHAPTRQLIARSLNKRYRATQEQIVELELQMASLLVKTPYLRLLMMPGINVVGAGDLAGEAGPIEFYPTSAALRGRAGIFPSLHQSESIELDGGLAHHGNRRLRYALFQVAQNLRQHNRFFSEKAQAWTADGQEPRVRVAHRFTRIAHPFLLSDELRPHPCLRRRDYVLEKLMNFHLARTGSPLAILEDSRAAYEQLQPETRAAEVDHLAAQLRQRRKRKQTASSLAEILPGVLALCEPRPNLQSGD